MFVKNIITSKNIMGFLVKVATCVEKHPLRAAAATSASLGVVLGIVVSKLVNKCDCGDEIRPATSYPDPDVEKDLGKAKTNADSAVANSILVNGYIKTNEYENIIKFGERWQTNLKDAGNAIYAVKNSRNATTKEKDLVKTYEERLYSMDSKAMNAILDARDGLAAAALAAAAARDADRAAAAAKDAAAKAATDKAARDAAAKEKAEQPAAEQPAVAEKAAAGPTPVRRITAADRDAAKAATDKAARDAAAKEKAEQPAAEQPAVAEKAAAGPTPVRRITAADRDAAAKEKAEQPAVAEKAPAGPITVRRFNNGGPEQPAAEAKETDDEITADTPLVEETDVIPSWQKIKRKLYT
jgi:hypothetical protein